MADESRKGGGDIGRREFLAVQGSLWLGSVLAGFSAGASEGRAQGEPQPTEESDVEHPNVLRLVKSGAVEDPAQLSPVEIEVIQGLSECELDCLSRIAEKVRAAEERKGAQFEANSNLIV